MKRLRIWLGNFSLLQQFLTIGFITVATLIFFIFSFLRNNIATFVNTQMYSYIHRAQNDYLVSDHHQDEYADTIVLHFTYNKITHKYLNKIPEELKAVLLNAQPEDVLLGLTYDGTYEVDNTSYIYSVKAYDNSFSLVSIIKSDYRNEFRSALLTGVVSTTLYVVIDSEYDLIVAIGVFKS